MPDDSTEPKTIDLMQVLMDSLKKNAPLTFYPCQRCGRAMTVQETVMPPSTTTGLTATVRTATCRNCEPRGTQFDPDYPNVHLTTEGSLAPATDAPAGRCQSHALTYCEECHAPAARDDANDGIALAILAATKNVDALYEAAKTLQDRAIAAEARAVRCECVIRDAAHLMATRMEGTPIVESYGAAYRVLFGYLYPDAPLPNASKLEAW